ncbi:mechanosensitive ion channel family protein [Nocardioides bruguierae]|uniref:Mechanosensitive ion channel family protein n=1 Tax=Nocardioides bruguierae TaxID=2945102 RepID=A0A9X2D7D1_9ACTN|nr:mechanosensitive ion channel family protein [Nocardioides bruguierae]MCL8025545.1 mechanosensitive ion channel family protein [Nocardioides bruguierae]MCM0620404.1 mechanosensitive ion channel family protein [Nocardioides bruguierae]
MLHLAALQNLTCADDAAVCQWVTDTTGNQTAGTVADWLVGKPLSVLVLLLLGFLVRWLLHRLVDRVVARAEDGVLPDRVSRFSFGKAAQQAQARDAATATRRVQRAQTMGSLLKSIVTGILIAVVGTMVLSEIGVNIAPIIASAGIVGVAVGFGAQSLVKDFFSGIFMIFEDQFGVGDVVDVGEATGTIEAVTLRVTRLRSLDGTVWYVPNGEILRVGNLSQNWSRAVINVGVAYDSDIDRSLEVLREVGADLYADPDFRDLMIEEPEVTGVEGLGADSIDLRLMVKTAPLQNWTIARELRQRIKARFDAEGIEIPFAQRVVWHRNDETRDVAEARAAEERAGSTD